MSDPQITISLPDFEALTAAVAELARVVQRIEESQPCALDFPGWEGTLDPYLPLHFQSVDELKFIGGAFRTIKEGPPELPECCLKLAKDSLSDWLVPRPEIRGLRAFRLGFWR